MVAPTPNPQHHGAGRAGFARYPLAKPHRLSLETTASRAGLHPELVRRFVALSLVDASRDVEGTLWFTEAAPAALARVQRLRAGLPLNYTALGLVLDLLDRVERMESELRARPSTRGPAGGGRQWT